MARKKGSRGEQRRPGPTIPEVSSTGAWSDRIKGALGLASGDALPAADKDNLLRYRHDLTVRMAFPFQAMYCPADQQQGPVTVVGLLDANDVDELQGLLCKAVRQGESVELPLVDLEVAPTSPYCHVIHDYSLWLHRSRAVDLDTPISAGAPPFDVPAPLVANAASFKFFFWVSVFGAACGSVFGALVETVEGARLGGVVGAVILGPVGCLAGTFYGGLFGRANRSSGGTLKGGLIGALAGAGAGSLFGAMAVTFTGTLTGGLVGGLAARLMKRSVYGIWLGAAFGGAVGAAGTALHQDQALAVAGALHGAWQGAIAGVLLVLAVLGLLTAPPLDRGWR